MQHESIQLRTAVQMFIDFLWEHREQLEQEMKRSSSQSEVEALHMENRVREAEEEKTDTD